MKTLFTIPFLVFVYINGVAQTAPPAQQAFCHFIAAFNRLDLDAVYERFSPSFQAQVDRSVCTGGLTHIYQSSGVVQSAAIAYQTTDEGTYYAIAATGVFKIMLSVDDEQRIDGLRIQQIAMDTPMPLARLTFENDKMRPIRAQ